MKKRELVYSRRVVNVMKDFVNQANNRNIVERTYEYDFDKKQLCLVSEKIPTILIKKTKEYNFGRTVPVIPLDTI